MKRFLNLIILLAYTLVSLAQESEPNAMYVYRNDGDFNAFFFSEVDSLTYSQYGEDSVLYDDMEVQVIWTRDSIYRIHTDVIDSISFTKPETKLQSDVVVMDANWLPYVINTDGMNITFNPDIVNLWQPKVGDVLVYMNFDDTFPDGFAGRVSEIIMNGNILISCDSVDMDDIWDEIIVIGDYDLVEEKMASGERRHRLQKHLPHKSNDIGDNINISWEWKCLSVNANAKYNVKTFMYKKNGNFIFELRYNYGLSGGFQVNATSKIAEKAKGNKLVEIKNINIPETPLFIDLGISPMAELEINAALAAGWSFSTVGSCSVKFQNGTWSKGQSQTESKNAPTLNGGLSGKIGFGTTGDAKIKTIGNFLSFTAQPTVVTGISCDISADLIAAWQGGNGYEICKDMTVNLYAGLQFDVNALINVYVWDLLWEKNVFAITRNIASFYLFPEFSGIECEATEDGVTLMSDVTRDLLIPIKPGIRLYKGGTVATEYQDNTHHLGSTKLVVDVSKLKVQPNETYTILPVFKLFNSEIEATPQATIRTTEIKDEPCLESEDENAVFFKKPFNWSSTIYCYLYDEYSGSWPGILATSIGNDYYKVVLNSSVPPEGNLIIWNVGGSQCTGDAQTNDLSFKNRSLYVINGSATNPNYSSGMNLSEVEDCLVSPTLPTCSTSKVTKICYDCECNQR